MAMQSAPPVYRIEDHSVPHSATYVPSGSAEDTLPAGISARGGSVVDEMPYPVFGGGSRPVILNHQPNSQRNFKQIRNEQELFGHAGSPIRRDVGSAGTDRADLDDEAMAQRVMEEEINRQACVRAPEENARRLERQRERFLYEE